MTKRVDLSLTIHLPTDHEADKVSVYPDGRVRVFDKNRNEVIPPKVERASHYERPKGRKYQSRTTVTEGYASVGGLEELARLDSFIVIDTNSVEIDGTKVSAAFFIACRLIAQKKGAFRRTGLAHLEEDKSVVFRYTYYPSLKITDSLVSGTSIASGTKFSVEFSGDAKT